jgi:hypothetical protein
MEKEQILQRLRDDLQKAREHRNEAARRFHEITDQVPTGIPYPDNVDRIKAASQEYASAIQAVEEASKAQSDFLLYGMIPTGFAPKPPGSERQRFKGDDEKAG